MSSCEIINQKPEGFKCELKTITPDWCRQYLTEENMKQGKSDKYTLELTEQIEKNEYIINGSSIIISNTNKILSGIEVLNAVVFSNKNIEHIVSEGIPDNCYRTIDMFSPRDAKDKMSILNNRYYYDDNFNSNEVTKTINYILNLKTGIFDKIKSYTYEEKSLFYINNKTILDNNNKYFKDFFLKDGKKILKIRMEILMSVKYIFDLINPIKSNQFFEILRGRTITVDSNPVKRLKLHIDTVADAKYHFKSYEQNFSAKHRDYFFWIINAWNHFLLEKPMERILNAKKSNDDEEGKDTYIYRIEIEGGEKIKQHFSSLEKKGKETFYDLKRLSNENLRPEIEIVIMTPEKAKEILDNHNKSNRKMKPKTFNRYVLEMQTGQWLFNGETIKFDQNGEVLDAQHRLQACVVSGKSFYAIKVNNIDQNAFLTYDSKKKNNNKKILSNFLLNNNIEVDNFVKNNISPIITLLNQYKNKNFNNRGSGTDMEKELEDNIDIIDIIQDLKPMENEIPWGYTISDIVFLKYLFSKSDAELEETFSDIFLEFNYDSNLGDNIEYDNFIHLKKCVNNFYKKRGTRFNQKDKQNMINLNISIWNKTKKEEKVLFSEMEKIMNKKNENGLFKQIF